jgi:hypothetical protein
MYITEWNGSIGSTHSTLTVTELNTVRDSEDSQYKRSSKQIKLKHAFLGIQEPHYTF